MSEINCQWRHWVTRQFYDNDEHLIADHFDYMGYLGWELVTVVAYPDKGYNAAYWKQSQVARDKLKTLGLPDYPGLGNWQLSILSPRENDRDKTEAQNIENAPKNPRVISII